MVRFETWPPRQQGGQVAGVGPQGVRGVHYLDDAGEQPSGIEACCSWERSQFKNKRVVQEMIEWALSSAKVGA